MSNCIYYELITEPEYIYEADSFGNPTLVGIAEHPIAAVCLCNNVIIEKDTCEGCSYYEKALVCLDIDSDLPF